MIAGGHALVDLAELRLAQQPDQLGLPDEDDLEQLLPARLQVGEEAHLLQHIGSEILGLVDEGHVEGCRADTAAERRRVGSHHRGALAETRRGKVGLQRDERGVSGEGKRYRERAGRDELGREVGLQSVENRLAEAERRDVGGNGGETYGRDDRNPDAGRDRGKRKRELDADEHLTPRQPHPPRRLQHVLGHTV